MPKLRIHLNDDDLDPNDVSEQVDELIEHETDRPRERSRPTVPAHKLERDRASKEWGRAIAKASRQRGDKRNR